MPQKLTSTRVLVTGADGFIGSHLAEALVRAGARVRALACYNSFNSWGWLEVAAPDVRAEMEIEEGDIRDAAFVRNLVKGCDIVLHLAALISIPFSYRAAEAYIQTNIAGTLNVLEAARSADVGRIVCTSTSEVYGTARFVPITEAHPLEAQSPYAATKIAADQLALSFHRSFDLPVVILRPFNTFGPRQSARAVIPTIITQIAKGKRQISLGSLHPTRDFSFVADTVRGFIHAAVADDAVGEVVNTGSGFEISIRDAAALIAEVMGAEIEIRQTDERVRPEKSEVERLFAGIDKAKKLLGWTPLYAGRDGLRRALAETVVWFSDPANLARYKVERYNI